MPLTKITHPLNFNNFPYTGHKCCMIGINFLRNNEENNSCHLLQSTNGNNIY